MVEDPLHSCLLHCIHEILIAISDHPLHRLNHLLLQVVQPHFDIETRAHSIHQLHYLALGTHKTLYSRRSLLFDVEASYTLEELADVLLHYVHAIGVG